MAAHIYEVSYNKCSERLKLKTKSKLEALYLYYKLRDNEMFDNNLITFKIDDNPHEVVRDDVIELLNERISSNDTHHRMNYFDLDALIDPEF